MGGASGVAGRAPYLWLAFDGEAGASGSGVLPQAHVGNPRYDGQWVLEVRLDRKSVLRKPFQMICS